MNLGIEVLMKIVEAGNWLSKKNVELRESVYDLITLIYEAIGKEDFFHDGIGWRFRRVERHDETYLEVAFQTGEVKTNKWIYVNVGKETDMTNICIFCEAITTGVEGKRLFDYLDEEAVKRNRSLMAISLGLVAIRAKQAEMEREGK